MKFIYLLIIAFFIEAILKPRLDFTRDGGLLIWYNNKNKRVHGKIF